MSNSVPEGWALREAETLYTRLRVPRVYDRNQVSPAGKYPVIDQSESGCIGYLNSNPEFSCDEYSSLTTFANHTCAVRQMTKPFGVIQIVLPLKAQSDVSQTFLFQILHGAIPQDGYKGHYPQLRETQFLTPPLPEQQKIAAILSSVDDVIEKTRAQIGKLKDLKTGMMQELLTKGIGSSGIPHTEFKDSPVGRIPIGWDIQPLLQFALGERHAFVNGPFGSDLLSSELTDSGVPVIYVRDLKDSKYDRVSTVCVTEDKADSLPACQVVKGDILVAKVGDPPCNSGVYEFKSRSIITQDVIRIRPSEKIDPYFFAYLLNSPLGRKQIEKIEIAGTRKRVSLTEFKKLLLPMPPHEEQARIGHVIRSVDQRIKMIECKNAAYAKAKKALMQDLLTGKVRVNVDQKEPAAA